MVVNAYGRPLCKHSKPQRPGRPARYSGRCSVWCEWRTVVYAILLPFATLVALLVTFVPHNAMFGLQ